MRYLIFVLTSRDPYPECSDEQLIERRDAVAANVRSYENSNSYPSLTRSERRRLRRIDRELDRRGLL